MTEASIAPRHWPPRAATRLVASDPGYLALKRAGRGATSFTLTVFLAWALGQITGQAIMSMALGFPVSIFASVIVRDQQARARFLSTLALAGAAALSFTASALITITWLNHAVFVLIIYAAIYVRRWGSRWTAAGFGTFVSFFFGAFLQPSPAALPWHMAGLLLAAASALFVQSAIIPHRPEAELQNVVSAIRRQLSLLLDAIVARTLGEQDRQPARRELARLQQAVAAARRQLKAASEEQAGSYIGFRLFEVETAAERLVTAVLADREKGNRLAQVLTVLRDGLRHGDVPPALPDTNGPVSGAAEELRHAMEHLSRPPGEEGHPYPDAPEAGPPEDAGQQRNHIHPQTRLAIQAMAGAALAIIGGELLSERRWYWAVITVFVMFSKTQSRGDVLVKSLGRLAGTVGGVPAGIGLIWLVGDVHAFKLALLPLVIFLTFYFFTDRYSVMIFFLTIVLALLYSLIGSFTPSVLWLRLEETAVGAAAGLSTAALLLPRSTHEQAKQQFSGLLDAAEALVREAVTGLVEGNHRSLHNPTRALDSACRGVRDAVGPLRLHVFGRGPDLRATLTEDLQACSYWLHELSLAAHQVDRPASSDARTHLHEACGRFVASVRAMHERIGEDPASSPAGDRDARFYPISGDDQNGRAVQAMNQAFGALDRLAETILKGPQQSRFFTF